MAIIDCLKHITTMGMTMATELTCEQRIDQELDECADVFTTYMEDDDVYQNGNDDLPPFHEYGLSFDYVEPNTFNNQPVGYYRYQLSWGGPSDELRFHPDGSITYHFMDWFDGAKRYVTNKTWAKWLREWFTEVGAINWDSVELYNYDNCEDDDEDEDYEYDHEDPDEDEDSEENDEKPAWHHYFNSQNTLLELD